MIFFGCGPTAGIWAFGRKLRGNDVLAFGVIETSAKLIFLVPSEKLAFYTIEPNLIELKISGSAYFFKLLILA